MSKEKKMAMMIAVACIVAGLLIALAALAVVRFDFRRLSTMTFETRTYEVQEPFRHIDIRDVECDVRLLPATDGQCKVVCTESGKIVNTVEVEGDTLTITRRDTRKWYERIGIWWGDDLTMTVYLPEQEYQSLVLKTVSGEIKVPDSLSFAEAEVSSTSGDISFLGRTTDGLRITSTSGEINAGNAAGGDVQVTVTSGDVQLSAMTIENLAVSTTSGNVELSRAVVEGSAQITSVSGEIGLERSDAGSLRIQTVSGDVECSLLSNKKIETKTTSGDIRVPPSDPSAGICSVTTTSGDIEIEIEIENSAA